MVKATTRAAFYVKARHHRLRLEDRVLARRDFLGRRGLGFGMLGLAAVLGPEILAAAPAGEAAVGVSPLSPRAPHFPARAKRVIHIFANGGPSHVDTFDPKPALERQSGKALPAEFQKGGNTKGNTAVPAAFKFKKYGRSGLEMSEVLLNLAQPVDDLRVAR